MICRTINVFTAQGKTTFEVECQSQTAAVLLTNSTELEQAKTLQLILKNSGDYAQVSIKHLYQID